MPARRCSMCNTNWPTESKYATCPDCDCSTWWSPRADPDAPEAAATEEKLTGVLATTPAHAHRVERYLALGFTEVDAELLAVSTEVEVDSTGRKWTRPLNWLRVAAAMNAGCTHPQALSIFSS